MLAQLKQKDEGGKKKNGNKFLQYERDYGFSKLRKRVFSIKCFSPKICFDSIQKEKPHSIIMGSGTLSPMVLIERILGLPFKFKKSLNMSYRRIKL
jgi:hypothetical protein